MWISQGHLISLRIERKKSQQSTKSLTEEMNLSVAVRLSLSKASNYNAATIGQYENNETFWLWNISRDSPVQ